MTAQHTDTGRDARKHIQIKEISWGRTVLFTREINMAAPRDIPLWRHGHTSREGVQEPIKIANISYFRDRLLKNGNNKQHFLNIEV